MPRRSPLKVFRTTIGFHDAYVAAPSRKAALEAWGADIDLFSAKMAEQVTDPELMAEPLAQPGITIRKARGTVAEHLAAATPVEVPKSRKSRPRSAEDEEPKSRRPRKAPAAGVPLKPNPKPPPPRPNRSALDDAKEALRQFEADMEQKLAQLLERERQIKNEREVLRREQLEGQTRLKGIVSNARDEYDAALQRWVKASSES